MNIGMNTNGMEIMSKKIETDLFKSISENEAKAIIRPKKKVPCKVKNSFLRFVVDAAFICMAIIVRENP